MKDCFKVKEILQRVKYFFSLRMNFYEPYGKEEGEGTKFPYKACSPL